MAKHTQINSILTDTDNKFIVKARTGNAQITGAAYGAIKLESDNLMTLRDDLIPCVAPARDIINDFGLRPYVVLMRTRTWSGSTCATSPKMNEAGL